jgi:hypothetical protein
MTGVSATGAATGSGGAKTTGDGGAEESGEGAEGTGDGGDRVCTKTCMKTPVFISF